MPGEGQVKKLGSNEPDGSESVDIRGGRRSVIEVVVLGFTMRMRILALEAESDSKDAILQTKASGSR